MRNESKGRRRADKWMTESRKRRINILRKRERVTLKNKGGQRK